MNGITLFLIFALVLGCSSCNSPKQETSPQASQGDELFLSVAHPWCYEIKEWESLKKPLMLKKGYFGKLAVKVNFDTVNLNLTYNEILRAVLRKKKDSLAYVDFHNGYDREPEHPQELLDILPQIRKHIEDIKVERKSYEEDCHTTHLTIEIEIK